MTTNQSTITGPNSRPTSLRAEALDREQHGEDRRSRSAGPATSRLGAATFSPSTAESTEIAGVMIAVAVEQGGAEHADRDQHRLHAAPLRTRRLRSSAASAMTPPSPSLSARMMKMTYLIETISVIVQKISEIDAEDIASVGLHRAVIEEKTVCSA